MKRFILLITYCLLLFSDPVSSQNIGIGTLTPNRARLELNGSVGSTSGIFGGDGNGISLQSNWPGIGFNSYQNAGHKYMANGYGAVQFLNPTNGFMSFSMMTSGVKDATASTFTGTVVIDNSGNMGIQTAPTNASLYVVKGNNFEGSAVFGGTEFNSHFDYGTLQDTYIRGGRSTSKVYINDLSGGKIIMGNGSSYVSINNGAPSYPLEIRQVGGRGMLLVEPANSFNNWEFRVSKPGGWTQSILYLIYNGVPKGYFVWGTGDYETFSDRRLKTDIVHMPTVLNKIMQLQPVSYEMKDPNTYHAKTTGFIAQDVKAIFPELVTVTADSSRGTNGMTDMHAINYNAFTAVTIKAIQEQQQVIKEMRQFNKELSRRIEIAEAILATKK